MPPGNGPAQNVKQMEIDALLEITRAINTNVSEKELLHLYDLTLQVHLRVNKIAIYLFDESWNLAFHRGISSASKQLVVEDTLLCYPDVIQFTDDNPAPEALQEFDLIIPVLHKEQPLAYVLMGDPHKESYELMDEKIRFIEAFTNTVVVAVENKKLFKKQLEQEGMKRELEVAANVQSMLIPDSLPDNERIQMAAVYLPHRNVGGDFYYYLPLSANEFIFGIADISGKGIGAALLMANFQAHVKALSKTASLNLKMFVKQLNENMLEITRGDKFMTMFLGRYNYNSRKLTYINCGHNPSVLYTNGESQLLSEGCTILGMFDELPFINLGTVDVPPDSVIINYTDGVTDLENEKGLHYSTDHMVHHLQRNSELSMREFVKGIMNEIYEFKGPMEYVDDISVLGLKIY
jgi:sigma-B regulation protein RsbU (phosphoserine phosphatase)